MAVNVWTKASWWTFSRLFPTIVKISNSVTRFSRCWLSALSWNSQISHSPLIQHGEKSCCCTFLIFGPLHGESATKYHNFSYISRKIDRIWIRQQQLFREDCCGHFETLHDFLASISDSASWRLVIKGKREWESILYNFGNHSTSARCGVWGSRTSRSSPPSKPRALILAFSF